MPLIYALSSFDILGLPEFTLASSWISGLQPFMRNPKGTLLTISIGAVVCFGTIAFSTPNSKKAHVKPYKDLPQIAAKSGCDLILSRNQNRYRLSLSRAVIFIQSWRRRSGGARLFLWQRIDVSPLQSAYGSDVALVHQLALCHDPVIGHGARFNLVDDARVVLYRRVARRGAAMVIIKGRTSERGEKRPCAGVAILSHEQSSCKRSVLRGA